MGNNQISSMQTSMSASIENRDARIHSEITRLAQSIESSILRPSSRQRNETSVKPVSSGCSSTGPEGHLEQMTQLIDMEFTALREDLACRFDERWASPVLQPSGTREVIDRYTQSVNAHLTDLGDSIISKAAQQHAELLACLGIGTTKPIMRQNTASHAIL